MLRPKRSFVVAVHPLQLQNHHPHKEHLGVNYLFLQTETSAINIKDLAY